MASRTEAFARAKIDALLKEVDWSITDGTSVHFEYARSDGTRAGFVLCDRRGRLMRRCSRSAPTLMA